MLAYSEWTLVLSLSQFNMIRIKCTTLFDITATGVRSYFKESRIPFVDDAGNQVNDMASWNRSRNQQRNWETVNQIISLRTLPENISLPRCEQQTWYFEFDVIDPSTVGDSGDPVKLLKGDAVGVPMIIGLEETKINDSYLITHDSKCNIWFDLALVNNDKED